MAILRVQGNQGAVINNATGPISLAFGSNVTNGNLVIVSVSVYNSSNTTSYPLLVGYISQSAGTATVGTWTLDVNSTESDGGEYINGGIYSVPVTATGSMTVAVNGVSTYLYYVISISEYSGLDVSASRVDTTQTGIATSGNSPVTATFSTSGVTLIKGCLCVDNNGVTNTLTKGSAYTLVYSNGQSAGMGIGDEEYITSGSQTNTTAGWTQNQNGPWVMTAVSYKAAAAGGANWLQMGYWEHNPYSKYCDMNEGNWRKNNGIYTRS